MRGRYIGIAKVPQTARPPRVVLDLTGGHRVVPAPAPNGAHEGNAGEGSAAPVSSPPPARRRRTLRTLRLVEVSAWLGALGVAVMLVAYLIARPAQPAQWVATPPPGAADAGPDLGLVVPGYATAACAFDSCAAPGPTGAPTRIRIARIAVDSPLEELGLDARGRLATPVDVDDAGWFAKGPIP